MEYRFLNIFLEEKDLLTQSQKNVNSFLIQNNAVQIEKIYNFYKGSVNLLYVNGFLGTGKADIVDYSTSFLSDEVIVLKYNCFNSTVLDDVLLSLYRDFKSLSAQNVILEPKIRTENFAQKVNSYFSLVEKPFLIILDSFEAILEENRQEIIDFIFHLNSMPKVKIVIIGRTFDSKVFKEIPLERITTLAFEKTLFEKYLKSEKIKAQGSIVDEFYRHTRGYYLFTALSIAIMKDQNLSLVNFLLQLKDSFLAFNKFLGKEALTLVPASEKNLFCFLSIIRHPISIELLKKIEFYNEDQLNLLINNSVVLQDEKNIYVQDYLKDNTEDVVPAHLLQKIRRYIIDLYQSQLPLKPLERDIPISRQTMRKEIDYHSLFLPKKNITFETSPVDINYMSYSKVFKPSEETKSGGSKNTEPNDVTLGVDLTKRKNISINLANLPSFNKEESKIVSHESEEKVLGFKELLDFIKKSEGHYLYSDVVELCQKALAMKNEPLYNSSLPFLYAKIAKAHNKMAQCDKAIEYYQLLKDIYELQKEFTKSNSVKFNIASIFYEIYKMDRAKELFLELVSDSQSSKLVIVKSYLKLASIEEDSTSLESSIEYYNSAFRYTDSIFDDAVLAELYFKYALIMDDQNDTKSAIDYYNKCINLNNNPNLNSFLSPAYSNIATLYLEKNESEKAVQNYTHAFEIDKQNDNLEGVYDSATKLASILQYKQPQLALDFLNIAYDYAKKIKDVFYVISSCLALGDFYCDSKKDEFGLKYYLKAMDLARDNLSKDNLYKIDVRINDVKFRLGEQKFDSLVEIIYEQESD